MATKRNSNKTLSKAPESLAFVKYEGELVKDGYMDSKKSAEAMLGFDEVMRYFLIQEDPELAKQRFEIPVKVKSGSWEIDIPNMLMIAGGTILTAYGISAGTELAKNDFKDKTTKDILLACIKKIRAVIKIANHVGRMGIKKFPNVDFRKNNMEIGIPDEKGVLIWTTKEYLDEYVKCPERLFTKLTKVVERERMLIIGVKQKEERINDAIVSFRDKFIYTPDEEKDNEPILPELKHQQNVVLEGHVTRGNENTNNIGFEYMGHVLTCSPISGSILAYAELMFNDCIISGIINRYDEDNNSIDNRPKIIFSDLKLAPRRKTLTTGRLFEHEEDKRKKPKRRGRTKKRKN